MTFLLGQQIRMCRENLLKKIWMQQIVFADLKTTQIFSSRVNYAVCFELFSKHFFSKHSNAISNAFFVSQIYQASNC
jgi:hypothetical protein